VSDNCLMQSEKFSSHKMTRTNYFLIRLGNVLLLNNTEQYFCYIPDDNNYTNINLCR
jgi:hypothetical protein